MIEKNRASNDSVSLVVSPGLWEPAERSLPLFDGLDCHCVSLSFRGRGQSDTPAQGYDLEHHVSDLNTVIDGLELKSFCLLGFSRGVGYACAYADMHPEKIKGLILVDHPPIHVKPWEGYASYWKNFVYLGMPLVRYMRPEALEALEREARNVLFWESLGRLEVPVAVLRGASPQSKIPSNLSAEDMALYRKHLKHFQEEIFEFSGHMIPDEELGKYRQVAAGFIERLR